MWQYPHDLEQAFLYVFDSANHRRLWALGISAWYGWIGPLWRAARHHGATQWELVEHRPAPPENDGQIWSD